MQQQAVGRRAHGHFIYIAKNKASHFTWYHHYYNAREIETWQKIKN